MATKLRVNGMWTQFRDAMRNGEEFDAGKIVNGFASLRGRRRQSDDTIRVGILPEEWENVLAKDEPTIDYVVYSYGTPIAWRYYSELHGWQWRMPDVRYSHSTTIHQGRIAPGVSQLNGVE